MKCCTFWLLSHNQRSRSWQTWHCWPLERIYWVLTCDFSRILNSM